MRIAADRGAFGVVLFAFSALFVGGTLAGSSAVCRAGGFGGAAARVYARPRVGVVLRVFARAGAPFAARVQLPCADGQGEIFFRRGRALSDFGAWLFCGGACYGRLGVLCRRGFAYTVRGGGRSRVLFSARRAGDLARSPDGMRLCLLFSLKAEQNPRGFLF